MIVVDTNVVLSGLVSSRGYSSVLLQKMIRGDVEFLVHLKMISEYHAVLTRRENLMRLPFSLSEIQDVLAMLAKKGFYQEVYYLWRPNLRDESDNFLLELAVAGKAESIVTFNKDDFESRELKLDIHIETPKSFLKRKGLV